MRMYLYLYMCMLPEGLRSFLSRSSSRKPFSNSTTGGGSSVGAPQGCSNEGPMDSSLIGGPLAREGWYGCMWRRFRHERAPYGGPLRAGDDGLVLDANDYTEKAWEAMGALGTIADKHESAYVEAEMLLLGEAFHLRPSKRSPLRIFKKLRVFLSFCCRVSTTCCRGYDLISCRLPLKCVLSLGMAAALLQDGPEGLAHRVLSRAGVSVEKLTEEVERHLERQPRMALGFGDQKVLGRGLQQVLASAQRFKREFRVRDRPSTGRP